MTPDAETRAKMVEAGAQAIMRAGECPRGAHPTACRTSEMCACRLASEVAITAAILAAEADGYKVTGPEATEEMILAAGRREVTIRERSMYYGIWTAEHDAAPKWGDGE